MKLVQQEYRVSHIFVHDRQQVPADIARTYVIMVFDNEQHEAGVTLTQYGMLVIMCEKQTYKYRWMLIL